MKREIAFLGRSLQEIRSWPREATSQAGSELRKLQWNLEPADWKPMKSVGQGVREIRVRTSNGAYRVIYVCKFDDLVHVLHAFIKKVRPKNLWARLGSP